MIDEKMFIKELYKFADEEIEKSEEMYKAKNFDMLMQHKYGENCFYKAIQKAKDMPKVGEWIPCSERLPERQDSRNTIIEFYFVSTKRGNVRLGFRDEDGEWLTEHGNIIPNVIAWMQLPEPYKE